MNDEAIHENDRTKLLGLYARLKGLERATAAETGSIPESSQNISTGLLMDLNKCLSERMLPGLGWTLTPFGKEDMNKIVSASR